MKKRYLTVLLAVMMLTLTACGEKEAENTESVESTTENTATEEYDPVVYEDLTSKLISLGEYKGLKGTLADVEITDADVQAEIELLKKDYAELADVDRAAELGDVTVIDFTGYVDGETSDSMQGTEHPLELGSGSFIPGFEDQLVGAKAGDDVEVNVTFPENYTAELAGKDALFEVHVHKVQAYDVAGVDEAAIKEGLGYDADADLLAEMRAEMETYMQSEAVANLQYELVQSVLDQCEFEIQESDVEAYFEEMLVEYKAYAAAQNMELDEFLPAYVGVTREQLFDMYRETCEFRVKMTLAFHEIANLEKLEVTDEEYEDKLVEVAAQYGILDTSMVEETYSPQMIREQLIQDKAITLIMDSAVVE